jgi:hypothetical protein
VGGTWREFLEVASGLVGDALEEVVVHGGSGFGI